MKVCTLCETKYPIEEFHNDKNTKDGKRSQCRHCVSIANKMWQAKNPEKAKESWKKAYKKSYGPELLKKRKLAKYSLSNEELDLLQNFKNGKCHICEIEEGKHIDHDHFIGKVRGMLCLKCNTALGNFKDDPTLLQKAIDYIKSSGFVF